MCLGRASTPDNKRHARGQYCSVAVVLGGAKVLPASIRAAAGHVALAGHQVQRKGTGRVRRRGRCVISVSHDAPDRALPKTACPYWLRLGRGLAVAIHRDIGGCNRRAGAAVPRGAPLMGGRRRACGREALREIGPVRGERGWCALFALLLVGEIPGIPTELREYPDHRADVTVRESGLGEDPGIEFDGGGSGQLPSLLG